MREMFKWNFYSEEDKFRRRLFLASHFDSMPDDDKSVIKKVAPASVDLRSERCVSVSGFFKVHVLSKQTMYCCPEIANSHLIQAKFSPLFFAEDFCRIQFLRLLFAVASLLQKDQRN